MKKQLLRANTLAPSQHGPCLFIPPQGFFNPSAFLLFHIYSQNKKLKEKKTCAEACCLNYNHHR